MTTQSTVVVLGATGTIGHAVAESVVNAGAPVRALVRSEASAAKLIKGVEPRYGDLRDEASLTRALSGARAVFYASPHEPDEEAIADRVVRACAQAQARLVFVGVHADGATRLSRAIKRWAFGRVLPHYAPKFRLSERVRQSPLRPIVLMPTNFFQNDELFRPEIENGVYPVTFTKPVNRVDVQDLADAAARALLDDSVVGGAHPVSGPASLTSAECTALWSRALGREVQNDDAPFQAAVNRALTGKKRDDFIASFGALKGFALPTIDSELAATTALLGRPPRSYRTYVEDTVAAWRGRTLNVA